MRLLEMLPGYVLLYAGWLVIGIPFLGDLEGSNQPRDISFFRASCSLFAMGVEGDFQILSHIIRWDKCCRQAEGLDLLSGNP